MDEIRHYNMFVPVVYVARYGRMLPSFHNYVFDLASGMMTM